MDKDKKRTKLWRKQQMYRHWRRRLQEFTAYAGFCNVDNDGNVIERMTWQELAKTHWAKIYKTTGTPCNCWMCRNYLYDRLGYKKDTRRIIRESEE